ncbi:MAG: 3-oxoacyl-ACP reductase FabG [Comamonas sp.]|nr:3-oxoacyl-ACP reductase FabG [Comamonas sp.]
MSQKVAYVTGGMGGIGTAICQRLHDDGFKVIAGCGPTRDYQKWLDEQKALGYTFYASVGNVGDWDSTVEAFAKAKAEHGTIDVLVNNAGITQPRKTVDITPADYDAVLDVSLRGTLYMSQAVIPTMQAQKSGSIVGISSVSAQRGGGILGGPHYSAAKAGVLGLAKAMAREFGADNIRVNCITPGLIATDINKGKIPEDKRAAILDSIPLGCIGEPNDVAGCVVFLASDLSKYCTGITLDVNGGMLIHG